MTNPCKCGCGKQVAKNYSKGHVRRRPIRERLLAKTLQVGDCWEWQGAISSAGYGVIGLDSSTHVRGAHRVSYEIHVAPIPEGLHIDHLCSNRKCINPEHLEPVTQAENNRRANKIRWSRDNTLERP